jgi:hypothetical protein
MSQVPPIGAAPSLLDKRSLGGIIAGDGFSVQERYIASLVPAWLGDTTFVRFQAERLEDADAWFEGPSREHRQVKTETLRQADVATLIAEFRNRNAELISTGRLRRFVIACAHLGPELDSFVEQLRNFRLRHFDASDAAERTSTLATLAKSAAQLHLGAHLQFILDHVEFDKSLAIFEGAVEDTIALVAYRLGAILKCSSWDESEFLTKALLSALHSQPFRAWSRTELDAFFRDKRRLYREGPPREAGDLIVICHQSLKRVDRQVEADAVPELLANRRILRVEIDQVARMQSHDSSELSAVAHDLASSSEAYRRALEHPNGRVLYYGFPHVPLAMLAGFVAQAHRRVELVEHDLTTRSFAWCPDAGGLAAEPMVSRCPTGSVARLRVSISATVREEACNAVLRPAEVRADLHLRAKEIGRGTLVTEAQARQHAAQIRRMLDAEVAGNTELRALHVFAAVPVSVAFLIGQALAHSSLPPAYIYNFDQNRTPSYAWRLGLREAAQGMDCVELLEEIHHGAA